MPNRTDGEDEFQLRVELQGRTPRASTSQSVYDRIPGGGHLLDGTAAAAESGSRELVAVGHDAPAVGKLVDPGGAEGDHQHLRGRQRLAQTCQGVIHDRQRILRLETREFGREIEAVCHSCDRMHTQLRPVVRVERMLYGLRYRQRVVEHPAGVDFGLPARLHEPLPDVVGEAGA